MARITLFVLVFLLCAFLIGCGDNSSSTTSSTGSTSVPAPSGTTDSFSARMFSGPPAKTPVDEGSITVDSSSNNGAGSLHMSGGNLTAQTNMSFQLQFCPVSKGFTGCFNVATANSDGSGNISTNFTFPNKGTWSGMFQLVQNGNQVAASATGSSGVSFQAALLPANSITGGVGTATGNAPGSGTFVINGTTAHVTLTGTTPNHTFNVSLCGIETLTNCTQLTAVTTDASGNAGKDVGTVNAGNSAEVQLSDSSGAQFFSAFRVQ